MLVERALEIAAAAVFVAISVPAAFILTAAWRWADLDATARRRILATGARTGLLFGAIGAAAGGLVAAFVERRWVGAAATVVLPWLLAIWSLRAATPIKRVHRLADQLDDPKTRDTSRDRLLAIANEADPKDIVGQSIRVSVATALSNGRFHADARRILEGHPFDGLDGHERELRDLVLLASLIHMRELVAARSAIARLPKMEAGSAHDLASKRMEALLLVHEGKPDDALTLVADESPDEDGEIARRIVLAHAHAAKNDDREVTQHLAWIEERRGKPSLARVVEPEGPASAAAWSRMQGTAAPYRR